MKIVTLGVGALLLLVNISSYAGEPIATSVAREAARAAFSELERQFIDRYFGKREPVREDELKDEHRHEKKHKKYKGHKKHKKHDKHHKDRPHGLAKKKALPPGLARQLKRNGKLPPGLEKRQLPGDLHDRLPVPPAGHERVVVGQDVVLIETASGLIRDIIRDVVRR